MEYKCPKCNATLKYIDNKYTCEYCKSNFNYTNIFDNSNYIIQFKIKKSDAINKYKSLIKSKFLTPSVFKKKGNIDKMEGIYVPCYLYDFEASGIVRTKSNLVNEWKSKGIKYEKTDKYENMRSGHMSLENICVVCTDKLSSNIMDLIEPFDLKSIETYSATLVEKYKVYDSKFEKSELLKEAEEKARGYFNQIMLEDIKDYKDVEIVDSSINLYNTKTKFILLPVWILNINYKKKNYLYLINGSTGKMNGNIVTKKSKIFIICIILFALIFCMLVLFNIYEV